MARIFLPTYGNPYEKVYQRSNVKPKSTDGKFKSFFRKFSLPALAMAVLGALGYVLRDNYLLRHTLQDQNDSDTCHVEKETIQTLEEKLSAAQRTQEASEASNAQCNLDLSGVKEQLSQCELTQNPWEAEKQKLNDELGQCRLKESKCNNNISDVCKGDVKTPKDWQKICRITDPFPRKLEQSQFFYNACEKQKTTCNQDRDNLLLGGRPEDTKHYQTANVKNNQCQTKLRKACGGDFGNNKDKNNVCSIADPLTNFIKNFEFLKKKDLSTIRQCKENLVSCRGKTTDTGAHNADVRSSGIRDFSTVKGEQESCDKNLKDLCNLRTFDKDTFNRICGDDASVNDIILFNENPANQIETCQSELQQCKDAQGNNG